MKLVSLIIFELAIWIVEGKSLVKIREKSLLNEEIMQTNEKEVNDENTKKNLRNDLGVLAGSLKIMQVPKVYFEGASVSFKASCNASEVRLGVDIFVHRNGFIEDQSDEVRVFRKTIKCAKTDSTIMYKVRLKLPRYLVFKPGYFNRYSLYCEKATLRIWLLSDNEYRNGKDKTNDVGDINNLFVEPLMLSKPFERPERPTIVCYTWLEDIKNEIEISTFRPLCPYEEESVKTIRFPVALSGFKTGVHRTYGVFQNSILQRKQLYRITHPEFTFVMWLYIHEYCPHEYCSVLQHITWNDNYATPRVAVNHKGGLLVELVMEDGSSLVDQGDQVLPKQQWSRLVLACLPFQCNVTVGYGENFRDGWTRIISMQNTSPFYFDDTVGLIVYGGSELGASLQGYIGQVMFYRTRTIQAHQIPEVKSTDMMLRLQLTQRESRCANYISYLDYLIHLFHLKQLQRFEKFTCKALSNPLLKHVRTKQQEYLAIKFHKTQQYESAHRLLKEQAKRGRSLRKPDMADYLYEKAEFLLDEKGPKKMNLTISLLKQSSCLGNHDATFMLAGILNYGFTVNSQEILSHSYLMDGGMAGNRLCLLSLGNKHVHGLDGFPVDYEQAYVYFKAVADMTNRDLEVHNRNDVYTEMVRLTNHYEVSEQTEEEGEVVTYLKLQANQGDFSAVQTLARMYYWGSGGLERDVGRAVEYYRMAALHNEPSALYDYGIILLKGHEVEKNVTKAVDFLRQSAYHGYPQALNTLGWYFMDVIGNFTEAASLFHKSHELGNKDASYNIAYMYMNGFYPASPVDKVKAWDYLAASALRGQFDASILIGMYNMRGHPRISRNLDLAVGWIRHVAEQNPGIGRLLFKGLKAYKNHNWFSTLVYYLMAASTGMEVANFNLAYLCEEDHGGYAKHLGKECMWRHYNLSIQRAPKDVDPYAWNKMAHYYYYYGIGGRNDTETAVELYAAAALSGDPQGLYNLAMLSNDGVHLNEYILSRLSVPLTIQKDNLLLSFHFLSRCQDLDKQESYLPCTFGMYRVVLSYYSNLVNIYYKMVLGVVVVILICLVSINFIHHQQTRPYNFY